MVKRETICTFACEDIDKIGRSVGQTRRSPAVRQVTRPPAPFGAHVREDFKLAVVIDDPIPPLKEDQQCCVKNPGRGRVRVLDRRFYPDDPENCSPAPENGEFCWGVREGTRSPYTVYNFSCQFIPVGGKVWLHRDANGGYWIATPIDPPSNIRVKVSQDVPAPEGDEDGKCVGPFQAELLEYDIDSEGLCSLVECDEENPITLDVYSDLCQSIAEDSIWIAEPFQDCEGCTRYWLRPKPVCRKRIQIIEEISPPDKQECIPISANAQEAPLSNKQARFSWMNFSADPGHTALMHEADGSVDKQDRFQYLHLYFNSLTGAPLPPTTTFAVVPGDRTYLVGKSVFIYDGAPDLMGEVTILTAVYDAGQDQTSLTWTPALASAPLAGSTIRVPAARCAGPYEVQVLDYITEEGVSQQDPDVCSLQPCEGETMEVYTDLPCILSAGSFWEAVPYAKCNGDSCCRYFIKDIRPHIIYGEVDGNGITAKTGNVWGMGDIYVYEVDPISLVESRKKSADCTDEKQKVYLSCEQPIDPGAYIHAELLETCIYSVTVECCPPDEV